MTHTRRATLAFARPSLTAPQGLRFAGLLCATVAVCWPIKGLASEAAAPAPKVAASTVAPTVAPTAAPTKPSPAAATQVAMASDTPDPMAQLRERLADRLAGKAAGAKAAPATGTLELRVGSPADAAAAGKPKAAVTKSKPSAAHGAAATASAAGHSDAAHWAYEGPAGPATWGGLRADFGLCDKGQRQSPIDIKGGLAVELEPVRFNYQPAKFAVIDNGHTVQANLAPGNTIELAGKRFELKQLHFHRPSEERIDGKQFEMSVHLVHKDEQGRTAVVALLLDKAPDRAKPQAVVQAVWNNLPLEKLEEQPARVPLDLLGLLPADRSYYTYMGSLTTPPCSEGVQWVVMRQPVAVTAEQVALFARLYPMNARPLQQATGRRILQSN
jgi:carbonic anhydrase